jgi:hypothetical protein
MMAHNSDTHPTEAIRLALAFPESLSDADCESLEKHVEVCDWCHGYGTGLADGYGEKKVGGVLECLATVFLACVCCGIMWTMMKWLR